MPEDLSSHAGAPQMTLDAPGRWPRRLRFVTRVPFLVAAGIIVVLAIAYTLAGFFLVPRLIATHVPRYAEEQLKRRAEVGEVRFNPLLFKLEMKQFRLQEADGRPILGFDRLFVDFELSSLFRRAWTFAEITLEAPRLDAVLSADGRLNVADLLESLPASSEPSSGPPPRVVLQQAVVRHGTVAFTDLTGQKPQTATIDPIDVELRDITTVPEGRGPYTILATLGGGGVVDWEGEVSLVPIGTTGRLGLQGFPLTTAWRFVQDDITVAEPGGTLDAVVRYQFAYREGAASLTVQELDVKVSKLALTQRSDGAPLLSLDSVHLARGRGDLIARELTVPELSVSRGQVAATMTRDGSLNWQQLIVSSPAADAPATAELPPAEASARPWRLTLEKVRVDHIAVAVADQRHAAPLEGTVADVAVGLSAKLESGPAGLAGVVEGLDVSVKGVALTQRGENAPLLAVDRMYLGGGRIDLTAREVTLPELALSRGRLAAIVARDGSLNWQTFVAPPSTAAAAPVPRTAKAPAVPPPAAAAEDRPWRMALGKVRVEQVALAMTDQSRATPATIDIGDLTVGLSAKLEARAAGLTGSVDGLSVRLAPVALREAGSPGTPLVSLDQLALDGGRIDLAKQLVTVSRVAVRGGRSTVVRSADGSLPLMAMLGPAQQVPAASQPTASPAARPVPATASRPWTVALGRFELGAHRLAVTDQGVTPPVQLEFTDLKASARDVRTGSTKPFSFDASLRVTQGGQLTARGQAVADGTTADVMLTLARFALTPAQPYVARTAAVELRSGEVSTTGRLTYRGSGERAAITYRGAVEIDGVSVVEADTGEPVLAWQSLHADPVRFGLTPDRLEIGEVRLSGLDGKAVIFADKSFSVTKLIKTPETADGAPAPAAPAADTPPGPAAAAATTPSGEAREGTTTAAFPVVVERLRVDAGAMHFADLSLVLPFATRVHGLNGVIVGLGSDPETQATLKLEGRVDEFGQVKVDGALSAYAPKAFTDIAVIFRNVPMSTLSPYSATFAGRRIRSGTMDLDLQYKVVRSALVGENKVLLRQLQLGERVESPGATRLPLDLAIAILSDAQGRIDLALPVRGNVDQPEFSYGHLIWQALVTVITRVATAPFRALAGLVGADAERLQAIVFEPGSDAVQPPEREKLEKVAEVLDKRTRLKLTVHGGYEAAADGEALRALHVRREVAQRLDVKLRPGEDPGPVAFDQVKPQRALETLLTERAGPKAMDEFATAYEKRTGKKPERASPVLALVGRGSGDRAFYEALFRRLVEIAPLADTEVADLGTRRAQAIARVLKERAAEVAPRVELGEVKAVDRAERNAVPSRLELGAFGG